MPRFIEHPDYVDVIYNAREDDFQSFQDYIRNLTSMTKKSFSINITTAPPLPESFLKRLSYTAKVLKTGGRTITFILTQEQKEKMVKEDYADLFIFKLDKPQKKPVRFAGYAPVQASAKSAEPPPRATLELSDHTLYIRCLPAECLYEELFEQLDELCFERGGGHIDLTALPTCPDHLWDILNCYYLETQLAGYKLTAKIAPSLKQELDKQARTYYVPLEVQEPSRTSAQEQTSTKVQKRPTTQPLDKLATVSDNTYTRSFWIDGNCLYIGNICADKVFEDFEVHFKKLLSLGRHCIAIDITGIPDLSSPLVKFLSISSSTAIAMGHSFKMYMTAEQKQQFQTGNQIPTFHIEVRDSGRTSQNSIYGQNLKIKTQCLPAKERSPSDKVTRMITKFRRPEAEEAGSGPQPGEATRRVVTNEMLGYPPGERLSLESAFVSFRNPIDNEEIPLQTIIYIGYEGVSFYSDVNLSPPTTLTLTITVPELPHPMDIPAKIVTQKQVPGKDYYILGAQFVELGDTERQQIEELFKKLQP